jgi:Mitochondrial carrier protein
MKKSWKLLSSWKPFCFLNPEFFTAESTWTNIYQTTNMHLQWKRSNIRTYYLSLLSISDHSYLYFGLIFKVDWIRNVLFLIKITIWLLHYSTTYQSVEAMTFGMPFEVWKTHMGTYRSEGTVQAFKNIYNKGGVLSFWSGWQPKLFESFMKGTVLHVEIYVRYGAN